jgi:hypothetical protein
LIKYCEWKTKIFSMKEIVGIKWEEEKFIQKNQI